MAKSNTGVRHCGFCMTGHHENCKAEIRHFDKVWLCYCTECHPDRTSEEASEETTQEN